MCACLGAIRLVRGILDCGLSKVTCSVKLSQMCMENEGIRSAGNVLVTPIEFTFYYCVLTHFNFNVCTVLFILVLYQHNHCSHHDYPNQHNYHGVFCFLAYQMMATFRRKFLSSNNFAADCLFYISLPYTTCVLRS